MINIIGIDQATQPRKTGLALGQFDEQKTSIIEVVIESTPEAIVQRVAEWIGRIPASLLAIDAPLGWPESLGRTLQDHQAGNPIPLCRDRLFRRQTDRFIWCQTHKHPLDVGADRIARTAHAALKLLEDLRKRTKEKIPLAWHLGAVTQASAIEVYPAATLSAYEIEAPSYKKIDGQEARRKLLDKLGKYIEIPDRLDQLVESDDALDAVICVLAGADFVQGRVFCPSDMERARKEGWIWVRRSAP
jgi:predicted RNase H-like nuclease